MVAVAGHEKEAVSEAVKTLSEDTWVEKLVLAEYVDCFIRHRRPRQGFEIYLFSKMCSFLQLMRLRKQINY